MDKQIDQVALLLTEKILALTPEDEGSVLLLDHIARQVSSNKQTLQNAIKKIGDNYKEEAGEAGIDSSVMMAVSLMLPAIYAFIKGFVENMTKSSAEKVGEKSVDWILEKLKSKLKDKKTSSSSEDSWVELEKSFEKRATELNLPKSTYEDILQKVKDNPSLLFP